MCTAVLGYTGVASFRLFFFLRLDKRVNKIQRINDYQSDELYQSQMSYPSDKAIHPLN